MTSAVATWLEKWSMKGVVSGTIDGWLDATPVPEVPYNRPFQKGKLEPFVVLHTSGSTGFPKPIVASQAIFCISHMYQTLPEWKGRRIFLHGYTAAKRLFIPCKETPMTGICKTSRALLILSKCLCHTLAACTDFSASYSGRCQSP